MLDASAALAYLNGEPGADEVLEVLDRSAISSVNWAETIQKTIARGVDSTAVITRLRAMGLAIMPFDGDDAEQASALWPQTRGAGLSLADRACLALAQKLGVPAMTADRVWETLNLGVTVQVVR